MHTYIHTYIDAGPAGISRLAIAIVSFHDINERDSEGCTPLFYAAGDRQVCMCSVCMCVCVWFCLSMI